jgi:prepilin-type N-terminal cleavage/methylation domain-containing protein
MRRLHPPRAGFTLIELLVVLAILGALTLVALRSVEGLDERARFDATQRALEDAREAILGEWRGDEFQPGFLSDLDRLPADLSELWQRTPGQAANHPASPAEDDDVLLPSGWRGAYLHLPPGADVLYDGWGAPLLVDTTGGGFVLSSLGADGLPGGMAFDVDQQVTVIEPPPGPDLASSQVSGTLRLLSDPTTAAAPENDTTWDVLVRAYMPDPETGGLRSLEVVCATEWTPGDFPESWTFDFTGADALRPGVRAFRAYLVDHEHPASALVSSAIAYRTLPAGASTLELVIP